MPNYFSGRKMGIALIGLAFSLVVIGLFLYFQSRAITPESVVKEAITQYLAGNKVYGLSEEQGKKITQMIQAPNNYNLPEVDLNFKKNHRFNFYLYQHILLITDDMDARERVRVIVDITYVEYNKEEAKMDNYIPEKTYNGALLFILEPDEVTDWKIADVSIDKFNSDSD